MAERPTPYEQALAPVAGPRFPDIRAELEAAGTDPRERDAFLLTRSAASLLHDLLPEGGLGEGVSELAALVHHAYLYWADGQQHAELPADRLATVLATHPPAAPPLPATARYVGVPPRRIWGTLIEGASAEPLDGCFLHAGGDTELRVLGVFGMHPDRAGFTVAEVAGEHPGTLARPDGSAPFAPLLPGAGAGLHSLAGAEELLALGWQLAGIPA